MPPLSRRGFFKTGALAAAALNALRPQAADAAADAATSAPASEPIREPISASDGAPVAALRWLDDAAPALFIGSTFGVPWPRGQVRADARLAVSAGAVEMASQSWPLATWPDGSLKWSAHALPASAAADAPLSVRPAGGKAVAPALPVRVTEGADAYTVDTGVIHCVLPKRGALLIASIHRDGREILRGGQLVALCDDQPDASTGSVTQARFASDIGTVTIEQRGPVRAVIKIDGRHRNAARAWLPFSVRLYFYAGAESVRIMHTFIFDGDEQKDFLRGLGLRFAVPLRAALHDRHVRFAGEDNGLWAEGVHNLTGLRRDPGDAIRKAQLAGLPCPPLSAFPDAVGKRLGLIPAWGDYTLAQGSADGFQIRKRTRAGFGWIDAAWGKRAPGTAYIGDIGGGVAFGLRDFWQRHPTQLDIRNAHTDAAEVTLWMVSPDAPAMDMRFYHDGMGMHTHAEEREGLEITYEDYEEGYGTPQGVARSSEITLWALAATPARARMGQFADAVQAPPQLVPTPAHLLAAAVFGPMWSLPDRSHPAKAAIEDQLDARFAFYRDQVEQRHWYGFWDYGDIRHSYDSDRHEWRYDVGGFAWDNSELSPDLWLWYAFLRSGRADIFRFAEAMVRHTSEVDTYHLGRFAGLGSRHNVQHWGCSAKQVRISTAAYRRFYYYLTADERVGDIMRSLLDADLKLAAVDPVRKLPHHDSDDSYPTRVSFGTDWASLAANWLTEWERGGDPRYRSKLLNGMRDIGAMRHGFFEDGRYGYDTADGHLHSLGDAVSASHLNAVFGAVEIFSELIAMLDEPAFERAWLQYCVLFNASKAEQVAALGGPHGATNALRVGHSRLTAYAAWKTRNPALARRAWQEFMSHGGALVPPMTLTRIGGAAVLNPIDEVADISTNETAQWCLAAIQNLAMIGAYVPG